LAFFSLVVDSEYLFVGLIRDELFDPTARQREESTTNNLRNSRRNQSKCEAGAGNHELASGRVPRHRRKLSPAKRGKIKPCAGRVGEGVHVQIESSSGVLFKFCRPSGAPAREPSDPMVHALQLLSESEEVQQFVAEAHSQRKDVVVEVFQNRKG
jgi:hypothetical protein